MENKLSRNIPNHNTTTIMENQLTIDIPDQSYTLGCLLRQNLFSHGAEFAACIVTHPQDTFLRIIVHGENPFELLESALNTAECTINQMLCAVDSYQCHFDALNVSSEDSEEDMGLKSSPVVRTDIDNIEVPMEL